MNFYEINPKNVDWSSQESVVFFNERHVHKNLFLKSIPFLPLLKSHIWLSTSGRTRQKWIALSKAALLHSAQSVNQHLQVSSQDRWGLSLPIFHVGGLSILARAYASQTPYFIFPHRWNPKKFTAFLADHRISLSSLTPPQVYDLVQANQVCPTSVRAIVIGGSFLNPSLYQAGRKLNWPLLPSYGLTECSSQTATANLNSLKTLDFPKLQILPHVQVKIIHQEIALKSKSLLTGLIFLNASNIKHNSFIDPKKESWFFTKDRGEKQDSFLTITGSEQEKILGEKVSFKTLSDKWTQLLLKKKIKKSSYFLWPADSLREGFQIALISDGFEPLILEELIHEFNQQVSPFEKIQQFYLLSAVPLTSISKLAEGELKKILAFFPKSACLPP